MLALRVFRDPTGYEEFGQRRMGLLQSDYFHSPLDEIFDRSNVRIWVLARAKWFQVYEFIEFLVEYRFPSNVAQFTSAVNNALEQQNSAYRLVGDHIVPLTNETEMAEVAAAAQHTGTFEHVATHIATAVALLSKKPTPDLRNAAKEAISAIEAAATALTGKSDLKAALDEIERIFNIHPAYKKSILSLFGYGSDGDGIRHALKEGATISLDEARFILVTSSAIANYLVSKAPR